MLFRSNVYKTITIGNQQWMAVNLRVTKYTDGSIIPNVTDNQEWSTLTTGAYCNFLNSKNTDSIALFGKLYNWYAVDSKNLAPAGWHVPTDAEWETLITYLDGYNIAGGKMKEAGTNHWSSPNAAATNLSGFTAMPAGMRFAPPSSFYNCYGTFANQGWTSEWWSSTANPSNNQQSYERYIDFQNVTVRRYVISKGSGLSIRCVKD